MRILPLLVAGCAFAQAPAVPWAARERVELPFQAGHTKINRLGQVVVFQEFGEPPQPPTVTWGDPSRERVRILMAAPDGRLAYHLVLGGVFGLRAWRLTDAGNLLVIGDGAPGQFATTPGSFRPQGPTERSSFVCKINPAGRPVFCTYADVQYLFNPAIAEDRLGNVYVYAERQDGALTPGALSVGTWRMWKLDPTGARVVYAAALEASFARDLRIDPGGSAVLVGHTGYDLESVTWLVRLSPAGDRATRTPLPLRYPRSATIAPDGGVALVEQRTVGPFSCPYCVVYQPERIHRYAPDGKAVASFTMPEAAPFVGPLDVDETGAITVIGGTQRADLPLVNPVETCYLPYPNGPGGFLLRLSPSGELLQSTHLSQAPLALAASAGELQIALMDYRSKRASRARWAAAPGATVRLACVASAANLLVDEIAPGMIVSAFGVGIGPERAEIGEPVAGRYPVSIRGITLTVAGKPAPLLYAASGQINAVVPWSTALGPVEVCTESSGSRSCVTTTASRSGNMIFSVGQFAVASNQDGTRNSEANPAPAGTIVTLWATGVGDFSNPVPDGALLAPPLPSPVQSIRLSGAGRMELPRPFEILYAGPAPLAVAGLWQINARVPNGARTDAIYVWIEATGPGSSAAISVPARIFTRAAP